MIFQLAHSAGGYYITTTEIQNKFYKTAEKMKNLADNNSEYLYKLGQKELDSTLSLSEQHIHDAWVAYNAVINGNKFIKHMPHLKQITLQFIRD